MSWSFWIIAALTIAGAVAALSLRNLVHCALALAITLASLALVYLQLDAQFVGLAQILVYIGAVAILVVIAILLTGGSEPPSEPIFSSSWAVGVAIAGVVFGVVGGMMCASKAAKAELPPAPEATVRQIGAQLMTRYVLPLEVVGLLLTAALIGAALIALREERVR
ncbi:NADH-ubiquinone oxidoreductase chain J [Verrucomicrobia bacterium]|nr:NADH-ubiquinone oxidoreductase chain J [Verrucomicrobiota bacterium]